MKLNDVINEAEKVRLDPKCWTGKKIGNPKTKVKGGVRVNNCVPAESVAEGSLGNALTWPEIVNKVNSAMKAMGWKSQRKDDNSFMFSTKGQEEESQWYIVVIENRGNDMFSYALGTFEGGRPDIGIQDTLPMTAASVSELMNEIRSGYGLDESHSVAEGSDERSQNRLWQMITDYEQRAKATKNDIKKDHYLKMASELRSKLKTSDEQGVAEGSEYKSRHAHKQEQDKAYNEYRKKHATSSLALMTRAEFAKDQRERKAKEKQGVAEAEIDRPGMKDGRPYSDPYRRHPGNSSYMTPEYLIQKYKERLEQIAAGPYKRPKEVAQLQSRIAKLEKKGVAEGLAENSDQNGWYVLDTKNRKIIANDVSRERAIAIAKSGGYSVWQTENGTFINSAKTVRYPGLGWIDVSETMNEQGVSEGICSIQEANAIFDDFERSVEARGLTEDIFDSITDEQIIAETAAWRRKEGKSAKGGLNAKGVASYRRENPGSKLQMAVTTKPSKLKPGSKAAKRRKSFCARMSGVKGPMKKPNGKPTRKALALRKWNC